MKSMRNREEYSFCIGYGYDHNEALEFREMLKGSDQRTSWIDDWYLSDRCNHWSAHRTISDRDWNYKACIDRVTIQDMKIKKDNKSPDMICTPAGHPVKGTYQLSGAIFSSISGTNDNILRIIP